jgi:hypothetical protein
MPSTHPRTVHLRPLGLAAAAACLIAFGVMPGALTAATSSVPTNTSSPTVSGTPVKGDTLTANPGTWGGTRPITFSYRWQRCNSSGGDCAGPVATGVSFLLGSDSVGNTFRVRVTASNPDGSDSVFSGVTSVITAPTSTTPTTTTAPTTTATTPASPPAANGCAASGSSIPVGDVSLPAQLSIDGSQISPSTVTYGTRTLTVRIHVTACGGSVSGALVYATAVPYGQFDVPNEQPTGSDGWATLQFNAQPGFPVSSKQQLLVVFVRATAPGASVIGGISARLLISFRVTK